MRTAEIYVENRCQDASQIILADTMPTSAPVAFPSLTQDDANRPVSHGKSLDHSNQRPLFGTHIREAVAIVKDWVRNG